jgi:hypothetical protein
LNDIEGRFDATEGTGARRGRVAIGAGGHLCGKERAIEEGVSGG